MTPNEFIKYCQFLGQQDGTVDYKAIVHDIMEKARVIELSPERDSDYLETHYVISAYIDKYQDETDYLIKIEDEAGMGGLWELSENLTDEFHRKYKDRVWEGDYWDTLEEFLNKKLNN